MATARVIGEMHRGRARSLGEKRNFDGANYQRRAVVPFESENSSMATLDRAPGNGLWILLKGVLDAVTWPTASSSAPRSLSCGAVRPASWEKQIDALGGHGLRVLAAASREVEGKISDLTIGDLDKDLVIFGLVGIV